MIKIELTKLEAERILAELDDRFNLGNDGGYSKKEWDALHSASFKIYNASKEGLTDER